MKESGNKNSPKCCNMCGRPANETQNGKQKKAESGGSGSKGTRTLGNSVLGEAVERVGLAL